MDTQAQSRSNIFISYSRKNFHRAEEIRDTLTSENFSAYLDQYDIEPGEPWKKRLGGLILSADKVIFLLSPASASSDICGWEAKQALKLGKQLIPIIVEETANEDIPVELGQLNFIFMRDADEQVANFHKLLRALTMNLEWEREKTRLAGLAGTWSDNERDPAFLLSSEKAISSGEDWILSTPETSPPAPQSLVDFFSKSRVYFNKRRRRLRQYSIAGLAGLIIFGVAATLFWISSQREADQALQSAALSYSRKSGFSEELRSGKNLGMAWLGLKTFSASTNPKIPDDISNAFIGLFGQQHLRVITNKISKRKIIGFLPDGKALAFSEKKQILETIAIPSLKPKRVDLQFPANTSEIYSNHSGEVFLIEPTSWGSKTAFVHYLNSGKRMLLDKRRITTASFDNSSNYVITTTYKGLVTLWSVAMGKSVISRLGLSGVVSDNGKYFAVSRADGSIELYSVPNQKLIKILEIGQGPIKVVSLSPDGKLLAASTKQWTKVWSIPDFTNLATLPGHYDTTPAGIKFVNSKGLLIARDVGDHFQIFGQDDWQRLAIINAYNDDQYRVNAVYLSEDEGALWMGDTGGRIYKLDLDGLLKHSQMPLREKLLLTENYLNKKKPFTHDECIEFKIVDYDFCQPIKKVTAPQVTVQKLKNYKECGPVTENEWKQIVAEIDPKLDDKKRYLENGRHNMENGRVTGRLSGQKLADYERGQKRDEELFKQRIDGYLKQIRYKNDACK